MMKPTDFRSKMWCFITMVKPFRQRRSMQFGAIIPSLFCSSRNLPLSRIAHSLFLSMENRSVWIFRAAWPIANKICPSWSGLVASVPALWECRVYIWGSCLSDVPLANDRVIELICGLCRFCNADTPFLSKEGKGVSASNSSPKTYNRVLLFVAGRSNVRSERCDFS